jgi:hypothetical protein
LSAKALAVLRGRLRVLLVIGTPVAFALGAAAMVVVLLLVTYIPGLSLWLPGLFR